MARRPAPLPPFVAHCAARLAALGEIRAKAMFGGWGFYADGVFFAIVVGEILFLKVDDANRPDYVKAGMAPLRPFEGSDMAMSYWEVPAAVMRSPKRLTDWAQEARAAQLRAKDGKGRTRRR